MNKNANKKAIFINPYFHKINPNKLSSKIKSLYPAIQPIEETILITKHLF